MLIASGHITIPSRPRGSAASAQKLIASAADMFYIGDVGVETIDFGGQTVVNVWRDNNVDTVGYRSRMVPLTRGLAMNMPWYDETGVWSDGTLVPNYGVGGFVSPGDRVKDCRLFDASSGAAKPWSSEAAHTFAAIWKWNGALGFDNYWLYSGSAGFVSRPADMGYAKSGDYFAMAPRGRLGERLLVWTIDATSSPGTVRLYDSDGSLLGMDSNWSLPFNFNLPTFYLGCRPAEGGAVQGLLASAISIPGTHGPGSALFGAIQTYANKRWGISI